MQTVVVDKNELLKKVSENRTSHRAQFEEAIEGYRERVIEELETRIKNAKKGRKIDVMIILPEPEDHTSDYDRVIAMLEMSIEQEIKLAQSEFAQYVMDDWGWKERFNTTSAMYSKK